MPQRDAFTQGMRSAWLGIIVNALLAATKLIAGLVGNAYALVADAVESATDIVSSLIVMAGLRVASRVPNEDYPFGYGRAETLAATVVSILLLGSAVGIAVAAMHEILTPHHAPAPWTLGVLVTVIIVKWIVSRRVGAAGDAIGSRAIQADAWHHLSDALTSAAAFIGISIALWMGPGWEAADDWAALFASGIIVVNGGMMLREALRDLMDRTPDPYIVQQVRTIATQVAGVRAIEKVAVRRAGMNYFVDIHVQAAPDMPLQSSHALGGQVKAAIRTSLPQIAGVLVHMEPFSPSPNEAPVCHDGPRRESSPHCE